MQKAGTGAAGRNKSSGRPDNTETDDKATADSANAEKATAAKFAVGVGRGIGGALLFALPMQMTMEMWALGFTMDRWRLVLLLVLTIPLLIGISHRIGFEETFSWKTAIRDAMIAFGIGIFTSAVTLCLFKLLMADMPAQEITGKIAVQAIPASIGALLGRSQLGSGKDDTEDDQKDSYGSELFHDGGRRTVPQSQHGADGRDDPHFLQDDAMARIGDHRPIHHAHACLCLCGVLQGRP